MKRLFRLYVLAALLVALVGLWRGKPVLAWFDCWVGWFYDQRKRVLYVFPVPMVGFKFGEGKGSK